jgi:hypothetical protein
MILLEKYIKAFLKEAASTAIANKASDLTGMSHNQSARSYSNDMSEIDNQEALLKVLENVGNNCFISFVDKYDEKIPRLEVSPKVSYDTPHGNYAYPLTIAVLKDIIEKGKVGGASFALERPYFHMFKKSDSLNSIEIQPDGSNNYTGDFNKDLRTIVHTAVMFKAAKFIEENEEIDTTSLSDDDKGYKTFSFKNRISRRINRNSSNKPIDDKSLRRMMFYLIKNLCSLYYFNNNAFHQESVDLIVDWITRTVTSKANSRENKFFKRSTNKLLSKFHALYYACFMLARTISDDSDIFDNNEFDVNKINQPQENRIHQGSIFTMLLNSIDVDFINDKGSSTLHSNEPIQAVYLNSSKKENVVLVGTFNNIFASSKIKSLEYLFSMHQKSSSGSNNGVTMNKVVDMIEKNPRLQDLFGTTLFDDVQLENSIEFLREKAWQDLTKKPLKIAKFKQFHSSNKIVRLNVYQQDEYSSNPGLIVFDIGFKSNFQNANTKQQLLMIHDDLSKIVQIENSLTYLQLFLSKYYKKNIYEIHGMSAFDNMVKTVNNLQNYMANIEIENDEDKKLVMSLSLFIHSVEDIIQLASIAHENTYEQ